MSKQLSSKINKNLDLQLNKAKEAGADHGGLCLSTEYTKSADKLIWKCGNTNHKSWDATFSNVVNNKTWCPECYAESKLNQDGLKIAQEHAIELGGQCLSTEYTKSANKLTWKCKEPNHKAWESTYGSIINKKSWCPECGFDVISNLNKGRLLNKNGLNIAQEHAITLGGQCLSTEYTASTDKLIWKCENTNHKSWDATFSNVVSNKTWCPECSTEAKLNKDGLNMAQEHAIKLGGQCLSTEYTKSANKLTWKCKEPNHKSWDATYSTVVTGRRWCPECGAQKNISEFRVRKFLEKLLNTTFHKRRNLDWNKSPTTKKFLELDGYSEKLQIAFEFQGGQHYKKIMNTDKQFSSLKDNDKFKKENCESNQIQLIIIDEPPDKIKRAPLEFAKHIMAAVAKSGINASTQLSDIDIDFIFNTNPGNNHQTQQFTKAKAMAERRGGECLSTEYIASAEKLTWKCKNDSHPSWAATYYRVVNQNGWCPQCGSESTANSHINKNGLKLANERAREIGGECLSTEYTKSTDKLTWKCHDSSHNQWHASYNNVVNAGRWCPECGYIAANLKKALKRK